MKSYDDSEFLNTEIHGIKMQKWLAAADALYEATGGASKHADWWLETAEEYRASSEKWCFVEDLLGGDPIHVETVEAMLDRNRPSTNLNQLDWSLRRTR